MPSLPLFPLATVLLPGGRLPLQVFEPRYLDLMATLLERPADHREFGVIAIRQGHEVGVGRALALHPVGTAARLDAVIPGATVAMPRLQILTTGTRRFRLEGLDPDAGTAYPLGRVTWLDEGEPTAGDAQLALTLRREHAAYLGALGLAPVTLPDDPARLPYAAADAAVLGLPDRQRLLDAPSLGDRLRAVVEVLRRERALVERFGALPTPLQPGGAALN